LKKVLFVLSILLTNVIEKRFLYIKVEKITAKTAPEQISRKMKISPERRLSLRTL